MPKDQSFYFSTSPRLSTSSRAKAWAVHSKTWTDSSVTLSSETTQLRLDLVLLTLSNLTPSALVSLIIFLNSFLSTMVLVVSLVPPKSGVPPGLLTPSHLTFSSLSCTSRASILSRSESITPSNFSRSFSISTVSRVSSCSADMLLDFCSSSWNSGCDVTWLARSERLPYAPSNSAFAIASSVPDWPLQSLWLPWPG
ncbi:hypothetical protein KCU87_g498, partial [Aureobasidium melanogenum]